VSAVLFHKGGGDSKGNIAKQEDMERARVTGPLGLVEFYCEAGAAADGASIAARGADVTSRKWKSDGAHSL